MSQLWNRVEDITAISRQSTDLADLNRSTPFPSSAPVKPRAHSKDAPSFTSNHPTSPGLTGPAALNPPTTTETGRKKKKKAGIVNFFTVKEPSTSAFALYQDEQRRAAALKGSRAGGLQGISQQKLPDFVPKVNSKWDGMPAGASESGMTSAKGSTDSQGMSRNSSTSKSDPSSSTEQKLASSGSTHGRASGGTKRTSHERRSKSSAFERPNGALQLYGQPTSPAGLDQPTSRSSPRAPRLSDASRASSQPRLQHTRSVSDISKPESQASSGAEAPPSLDGVHTSPELPPKVPDDAEERPPLASSGNSLTPIEHSPLTPDDVFPESRHNHIRQNPTDVPDAVGAPPTSDQPALQWPLPSSMTQVVLKSTGPDILAPLIPTKSPARQQSSSPEPTTEASGPSSYPSPPESFSRTYSQKLRNFARPFIGAPATDASSYDASQSPDPYFLPDAASIAGPVRRLPMSAIGRSIINISTLPPIMEVDRASSVLEAPQKRASHVIIEESSDNEDDDEVEDSDTDTLDGNANDSTRNHKQEASLPAAAPQVTRIDQGQDQNHTILGDGDPISFSHSDDSDNDDDDDPMPHTRLSSATNSGRTTPTARRHTHSNLSTAPNTARNSDIDLPLDMALHLPPLSSRTSISSEMSAQWYRSPRERLGLGGFIKHDRKGGVPWPTDKPVEDAAFVVGERRISKEKEREKERMREKEKEKEKERWRWKGATASEREKREKSASLTWVRGVAVWKR